MSDPIRDVSASKAAALKLQYENNKEARLTKEWEEEHWDDLMSKIVARAKSGFDDLWYHKNAPQTIVRKLRALGYDVEVSPLGTHIEVRW